MVDILCIVLLLKDAGRGDTIEEALQNIKEAIAGYLKTLNERAMLNVKIQSKVQIREVAVA